MQMGRADVGLIGGQYEGDEIKDFVSSRERTPGFRTVIFPEENLSGSVLIFCCY